ncbi:MAG TPA: YceI family protein [Polyangiaceae bacterium]|nr:YceI family protein [Polyangiaceae bacterium]
MVSAQRATDFSKHLPVRGGNATFLLDTLRTRVSFSVRHVTGRVHGVFTRAVGVVDYDPSRADATTVHVTIQSSSVVTHDETRDARLRSCGFLDCRAFPQIEFVSTSVRRSGRKLDVSGELTLHGVTRPVTVSVGRIHSDAAPGEPVSRISAPVRAVLHRSEFGVGPSSELELGGLLIGDDVAIEIDLELVRK